MRRVARLGLIVLIVGCGESEGALDAATSRDASALDAAHLDASVRDAATSDAPTIDAPADDAPLDVCEDGARVWLELERIAPIARDTDDYRAPTSAARDAIGDAVTAIAEARFDDARSAASAASYVLCRGEGDEAELVVLRPSAPETGHATLVIDTRDDARPLILEAPHPIWDADTEAESAAIFARTGARAVLVAGTHRCGSDRASGCDGTADACGPDAPVRESDMAHATDSIFHAAHVALAAAYPTALVVGVHGMSEAGISVSDGTSRDTGETSAVARFARALHARFPTESITTCNDFGDPDVPRDARLCGTTDAQGRHLNGAPDACVDAAGSASGRFLHLEQNARFRPEESDAIADALLEAIE
ncbi:hypothetical protein [Sandaracinus amylolyticus]|uniref:Uncharacterized protein n=1 Tax=Sandaracinus amylolyticus TaxID=927083 RepID=A0A0F6SI28_9BACT|nr:hypothetical protein [Sandaracinus amylolyticus]AKF11469.1 hypothetical protein DB32_008618 [Sandaracinus amylolyticus]